jgi:hypothetical protein
MARPAKKSRGGRTTPNKNAAAASKAAAARPAPGAPGQVGRRPPNPFVPMLAGIMWIVVGIIVLTTFTAGWRFVVGAVSIGVGLLFVRGALTALARRDR